MITRTWIRHSMLALAIVFSLAVCAPRAFALDVQDVENLLRNHVSEDVIINMVEEEDTMYITMEEANVLRGLGASENLIEAMRPVATTYSSETVVDSSTPIVTSTVAAQPSAPVVVQSPGMPAAGTPITPVAITMSSAFPPRYDKEGWLTISNRDWQSYYVNVVPGNKRIFLSKAPNGGMELHSGQSITLNLRKETYKTYGDTGRNLNVKVREGETTTLSLNPFGVFGNSGLTGVATDREKVRTEVLFSNYVPAPTIVVQEPAPVVVVPGPPVYYGPRYYHRPPGYHFNYRRW